MDTLYILTRSSGRAEFFRRCRESVKALTYPGPVVHIVHTDYPRDRYVEGDIIVRGEAHGPNMGSGPYNLYQNRLIDAIPSDGWVHFLDDDYEYTAPDVFDWLPDADPKMMHICKVKRGGDTVWSNRWKHQTSFQTECFVVRQKIAKMGKWWADKGGDHYYTRQLTKRVKLDWHDILIVQAQEGKGHGARVDIGGVEPDYTKAYRSSEVVPFKMFRHKGRRQGGKLAEVPYGEALVLEKHGFGRVTYRGVTVC